MVECSWYAGLQRWRMEMDRSLRCWSARVARPEGFAKGRGSSCKVAMISKRCFAKSHVLFVCQSVPSEPSHFPIGIQS